jgi:hypothetical protein
MARKTPQAVLGKSHAILGTNRSPDSPENPYNFIDFAGLAAKSLGQNRRSAFAGRAL